MGVNSTKLTGYRAILEELNAWLQTLPDYSEIDYNPAFEAACGIQDVIDDLSYLEEAFTVRESETIERGE